MSIQLKKILISDPIDEAAVKILRDRGFQVDIKTSLPKDQLIAIIPEYDALVVRSGTQVTKEIIEAGHRLKLIGRAGVGVDNIDCDAATKAGIVVINAPAGNTISAVELTCAMILASSRQLPQACASLKNGVWDRKTFVGNEIKDKTLAIIGLGRIGREVAVRMQSFGMTTIGHDPLVSPEASKEFNVEWLPLEQIWPRADFITLHTPLIPQTKNLINSTVLAKCKKGVRIINVARGGIVDETALLEALQSGQVGGAGLDVFMEEPPANTHLVKHPQVVCTPHLGASTKEAQNNVAKEIALQFLDIVDGKSVPGVVNAPLLSETLKHENLLWTRLGQGLGKLAATQSLNSKSLTVTVNGFQAVKVAKLIKESVLVGFLTVRTKTPVNIISASNLAVGLSIESKYELGHQGCFSSVKVELDDGTKVVGQPQGRRSYLSELNNDKFQPLVALEGVLSLVKLPSSIKSNSFLSELIKENEETIVAITRAQNQSSLYAIHSVDPKLSFGNINKEFILQLQF